jgi:putative spermidine/putrescine transport system permease protein
MNAHPHHTIVGPAAAKAPSLWRWLGIAPFMLFVLVFLILPTLRIMLGAFQKPDGTPTLDNIAGLFKPSLLEPAWVSVQLSAITALLGCIIGFLIA